MRFVWFQIQIRCSLRAIVYPPLNDRSELHKFVAEISYAAEQTEHGKHLKIPFGAAAPNPSWCWLRKEKKKRVKYPDLENCCCCCFLLPPKKKSLTSFVLAFLLLLRLYFRLEFCYFFAAAALLFLLIHTHSGLLGYRISLQQFRDI